VGRGRGPREAAAGSGRACESGALFRRHARSCAGPRSPGRSRGPCTRTGPRFALSVVEGLGVGTHRCLAVSELARRIMEKKWGGANVDGTPFRIRLECAIRARDE